MSARLAVAGQAWRAVMRGHPSPMRRAWLAGSLSFASDTSFFGDMMTRSPGLVGEILKVDCH